MIVLKSLVKYQALFFFVIMGLMAFENTYNLGKIFILSYKTMIDDN